jgi:hypothetical protein
MKAGGFADRERSSGGYREALADLAARLHATAAAACSGAGRGEGIEG